MKAHNLALEIDAKTLSRFPRLSLVVMCEIEMKTPYQIALGIFKSFQRDFPKLHMELNKSPVDVDLEMKIPAQEGMKFPIYMNLQNKDELHVVADAFWCEWFPCLSKKGHQNMLNQ